MAFAFKKAAHLLAFLVVAATSHACFAQISPFVPASTLQTLGEMRSEADDPALARNEYSTVAAPGSALGLYATDPHSATVISDDSSSWLGLVGPSGVSDGSNFGHRPRSSLPARLIDDQLNFYSPDSLLLMGFGLGTGAVFANTTLDGDIQRHLQSSLRHANSDDWLESLHANKELGDGRYTLPIYAGAWALGSLLPESEFSNNSKTWGERTLRGFIVGAPPVLLLQKVTGGSRPGETPAGSDWEPFRDNNGVSGHAFMGALPFITAAKMSDKLGWKVTWYAASTLAPLSRAADGAHYPSQVALGWGMAFLAATAVHSTRQPQFAMAHFAHHHSQWIRHGLGVSLLTQLRIFEALAAMA